MSKKDKSAIALLTAIEDRDLMAVNYDDELEGSTEAFAVRPCVIVTEAGNYMAMYGIYNRNTGIREAEQRQYSAAVTWAEVLTNAQKEVMSGERTADSGQPVIDLMETTEVTH